MEQSLLYGSRGLTVLSGSGDRVTDATGREYVDFLAGHGAALFGHAHPRLRLALEEAAASPWTIGAGLASPFRERFLADLESMLPESRAFLCNSGTEAVEAALKLLRVIHPGRRRILALRRAFHGRTLGALGLTFNPRYRAPWKELLLSVEHLEPEHLPDAVDEHVAAVFVEPVQGEGGMATLSPEVGKALTEACRRWGALLVADEIQTGWGRCGALLASSRTGLDPDLVCLAKGLAGGLPAGALLWRRRLGSFPPGGHGSTYGGNPLVCAVGHAAFGLLQEGLPERADALGKIFRDALGAISSPRITDVLGLGLLVGVSLDEPSAPLVTALQERGILALSSGPKAVRFLPPLPASEESVRRAVAALADLLSAA